LEYQDYEESLKYYRDLKNSIDTAYDGGKSEGKIEGKIETASNLKKPGVSIDVIIEATGLSRKEIEKL
jgi:predicted transposase/invertase (TIGR01784 family)